VSLSATSRVAAIHRHAGQLDDLPTQTKRIAVDDSNRTGIA
jgi:hypothetical protein